MQDDDVPEYPEAVSFVIRSIHDPAVQALFITGNTFDLGMSPRALLALSIGGICVSLGCLVCVFCNCVALQKAETKRIKEERRRQYLDQDGDADDVEEYAAP